MSYLKNGKDMNPRSTPLGLPNMRAALARLLQSTTIGLVTKTPVKGFIQETTQDVCVRAVRLPFSATALSIRPEGERSWRWNTFYMDSNTILKTDDQFFYNGVGYRVMEVYDFREYGYMQYSTVEGFKC